MIAFQRWDQHGPGDDVVIVLNMANQARENYRIGMPLPGHWKLSLNSDAAIYSDDFGDYHSADVDAEAVPQDGLDASAEIAIGPYSLLVYTLDKE